MQKPDVDQIGRIISSNINRTKGIHQSLDHYWTVVEIHDYLRLMFARIGVPHSPETGLPIKSQTITRNG